MTGIIVNDGQLYNINIQVSQEPDTFEWMAFATCKEFPDVLVIEKEPTRAYWGVVDTIEGLIDMAIDMGHSYPDPE